MSEPTRKLRVWLRSVPGPVEQYNGHVDVAVPSSAGDDQIKAAAVAAIKRTFPDRNAGMWNMGKYESAPLPRAR